jgi:hypothetical protein
MKISIFVKTSLKRLFSFQTLLRVVFYKGLVNPSPGPWDEDEWQEVGVVKRRIPYGRTQKEFFITQV